MRPSPRSAVVALALATLSIVGCTASTAGSTDPDGSTERPDDVIVELVGLDFRPSTVTVAQGRWVRWQWTDSVVHNIISDDFASLKPTGGGNYSVKFDRAGRFPYRCTLHTGMDGTIVVTQ